MREVRSALPAPTHGGGGGVALRLRKCDDQRVGVRWTPPRPLLRGTGPSAGPVSPAPSLRPWARTPPSSPCASACPSNPRGTSRSPTLPSCSPWWWETPEPPQEGRNALLELSQQSAPPGTSLPRLSEHAGPWQPHKGPLCARAPRLPGSVPAASAGRAARQGTCSLRPGASTAGRKLCGQGWSRAGGGTRGCGAGRCGGRDEGSGARVGGMGGPGVGGMRGPGAGRGGAAVTPAPVPGVDKGLHPIGLEGSWASNGTSCTPVECWGLRAPRPPF